MSIWTLDSVLVGANWQDGPCFACSGGITHSWDHGIFLLAKDRPDLSTLVHAAYTVVLCIDHIDDWQSGPLDVIKSVQNLLSVCAIRAPQIVSQHGVGATIQSRIRSLHASLEDCAGHLAEIEQEQKETPTASEPMLEAEDGVLVDIIPGSDQLPFTLEWVKMEATRNIKTVASEAVDLAAAVYYSLPSPTWASAKFAAAKDD
jgi:hypothetical protein